METLTLREKVQTVLISGGLALVFALVMAGFAYLILRG